jgi:hypothetical protein
MTYDSPFRDATLVECSADDWNFYHTISANADDDRVMSSAAYDVVGRTFLNWIKMPGVLNCALDVEEQAVKMYIATPDGDDHVAEFTLPLAELVLSAADTCQEWDGPPPSHLSALLRKLADQIDGKEAA